MTLDDVILLEKHRDLIKDRSQVIYAEGVTNASKSFIIGIAFLLRIISEPPQRNQFLLGGKSLPVLEKMFIQNESSFYNIFKPICQYKSSGEGGARIVVNSHNGEKIIYLAGYDNKSRWSDILGLTLYGFNIEEINIADNDFVSELFIRVFRNSGFLYCSSNGGDPDIDVYTKYLNKGRPLEKWYNEIPKETIEELDRCEADSRYRYYFFNFDDNPVMTQEEKQALIETTPKGSYQWMTKILGIRGIREGVIYAEYMTREKNIIPFTDVIAYSNDRQVQQMYFNDVTIGIDVGGTDYTVFTLNGFTAGYDKQIVIDGSMINNANHDKIWEHFVKWFTPYFRIYGNRLHGAFIDSAAKIMRLTFDERLKKHFGLQCVSAYKYTIKERVDWGIAFLDQGRLQFTDKAEQFYISFTKAYYTERKNVTDIREYSSHEHKDKVDSVEYGQSPFTARMLRKR